MAKTEIRHKYQVWVSPDRTEFSYILAESSDIKKEKESGLMHKDAFLLHEIIASNQEEAMSIINLRLGYGPYKPQGKPELCPKGCGSYFYPEGSGQCAYCGKIC